MLLRELRLFLGWLVQVCFLMQWVAVAAAVWLMSGWCTTLVVGVADCYLPRGCRGLFPLCLARRPVHSFMVSLLLFFVACQEQAMSAVDARTQVDKALPTELAYLGGTVSPAKL